MPTWNAEAFIEATLASLDAQTYQNLEVLISDDSSTDRTTEICERFAASRPRCRFIRQGARRGWTGNVTALLHEAEGDYFFFAFHDDPLKPAYVSRLVEALARNRRQYLRSPTSSSARARCTTRSSRECPTDWSAQGASFAREARGGFRTAACFARTPAGG
jgi:glycosyltransferase involved in cell wall biosynthesis